MLKRNGIDTCSTGVRTEYSVPGNGLKISISLNSRVIEIVPGTTTGCEPVGECLYAYTSKITKYEFKPEDYKKFWHEYLQSNPSVDEYERMRKALSYAIRIYRRKFGDIFV